MRVVNDFLATVPFDLYGLFLFKLVARHRSFTKAAEIAGLTQSAITRQVQGMEESLGLQLLERTTRTVGLTPAGEYLLGESEQIIGTVEQTLRRLREGYAGARKEVRVGVSQTIGLAYLPGFFHANLRRAQQVGYRVTYDRSAAILAALESHETDLGVLCPPERLPRGLTVTHQFRDAFALIAPNLTRASSPAPTRSWKALGGWLQEQTWLQIEETSHTGQRLRAWIKQQGWKIEPTMQLDNFDLIINLVALGMGVSFVPIRALALYGRKRTLRRIPMRKRFERDLVVVMLRRGKSPEHVTEFVRNVLF